MNNLNFAPPDGLNTPLWRSLVLNIIDRAAPERLPPLQLTSKPMYVGTMLGDRLAAPWFKTVFTNIADVVAPEDLPPLELTSTPLDIGELVGDDLDHPWWQSLLGNIRDRLSPEVLPPLEVTTEPFAPFAADTWLQILDWSSLLDTPKLFMPDAPAPEHPNLAYIPAEAVAEMPVAVPEFAPEILAAQMQFRRDISRSRLRQKIWISLVAAQVAFLVFAVIKFA